MLVGTIKSTKKDEVLKRGTLQTYEIRENASNNGYYSYKFVGVIPWGDSSSNKYTIVPKYEDVLYDSLFNIRKENKYEIHWFGMIDGYENFYNKDEPHIDPVLTEFLRKEKIKRRF